jgi:hypothetical protein
MNYGSKPTIFGNLPWPPTGPDLNPMVGTIPPQKRYEDMGRKPFPPQICQSSECSDP